MLFASMRISNTMADAFARLVRVPALLLFVALATGCRGESEGGFEVPTARYVNTTYGFSIEYPDTMDIREYTPERISIGFAAGDGFDPHLEITVDTDSAASFNELVDRKARDSCAADGPGISINCTTIQRRGTLRAKSREKGDVLYLTLEISEPGGAVMDSMPRGPYVAFELPTESDLPTVLFVRAATTRQLWETDVKLIENAARSLEIED
jgi:hypothetical protein